MCYTDGLTHSFIAVDSGLLILLHKIMITFWFQDYWIRTSTNFNTFSVIDIVVRTYIKVFEKSLSKFAKGNITVKFVHLTFLIFFYICHAMHVFRSQIILHFYCLSLMEIMHIKLVWVFFKKKGFQIRIKRKCNST